jgi:hypothetical protein
MIVFVSSPLKGAVKANRKKAKEYCEQVFERGHFPIAPHVILDFLSDNNTEERERGIQAGLEVLAICDEVWVFGDKISDGMKAEIEAAERLRIPVKFMDM